VSFDIHNKEILNHFLHAFESELERDINSLDTHTNLKNASLYSLSAGGKRIRPMLVFSLAEAAKKRLPVLEAALSVEYFHTASLIADDLPLMDNDDYRRGVPTLHKKFDPTTALLTSYGLICRAFKMIHRAGIAYEKACGSSASDRVAVALKIAARSAGFEGATGGQYLDLFADVKNLETYLEISQRKTASLFEVSFCLGWIFGGGELDEHEKLIEIARAFGFVFQAIDDYADIEQDAKLNPAKNLFHLLPQKEAMDLLKKIWERYWIESESYREKSPTLSYLSNKLLSLFPQELLESSK
jgi:geranylgeranyl diphosphate synthase type II